MTTKILFWDGIIGDRDLVDGLDKVIEQLLAGDYQSLDLEKLHPHDIFSIRINDADRLLFTTYRHQGKNWLLILDVVDNHDYHKSKYLKNRSILAYYLRQMNVQFDAAVLPTHFVKITAENSELRPQFSSHDPKVTPSFVGMNYFNRQFIELNQVQKDALTVSLPAIISGAAGSGKSCVAQAILEQYCRQSDFPPKNILYITASERLTRKMQRQWQQSLITEEPAAQAIYFKSYSQLVSEQPEFAKKTIVTIDYFIAWIHKTKLPKALKAQYLTIYQEFRAMSAWSPEDYLACGQNQSSFYNQPVIKDTILTAFNNYKAYLSDNDFIDPALYTLSSQTIYDAIIVDEAQDLSPIQLQSLTTIACSNHLNQPQICLLLDTHQSIIDSQSNMPFILSMLHNKKHPVPHIQLPSSYRCPPDILDVANTVIRIKNHLKGGVDYKGEYTQLLPNCEHHTTAGEVRWLNQDSLPALTELKSERFSKSIRFAIITHQQHKTQASRLFNTNKVYTPADIKGLEFDTVVAFRLFDSSEGYDANALLQKNPLHVDSLTSSSSSSSSSHLPKHLGNKELSFWFNQILTAFTRAQRLLIIYEEEKWEIKALCDHFKQQINQSSSTEVLRAPEATTDKEYDEFIEQLRDNGLDDHAHKLQKNSEFKELALNHRPSNGEDPIPLRKKAVLTCPEKNKPKKYDHIVSTTQSPKTLKSRPQKSRTAKINAPTAPKISVHTSQVFKIPKIKFKPSKEENKLLIQLDTQLFNKKILNKLALNPNRVEGLFFETPFKGEVSVFMYAMKHPDYSRLLLQLNDNSLLTLIHYLERPCTLDSGEKTSQLLYPFPKDTPNEDTSILYWLTKHYNLDFFEKLLSLKPDILQLISPTGLCRTTELIINNLIETSPLYHLSLSPRSRLILNDLLDKNSTIAKQISLENLTAPFISLDVLNTGLPRTATSILCYLTEDDIGLDNLTKLLDANPDYYGKIGANDLFHSAHPTTGISAFFNLTTTDKGLNSLEKMIIAPDSRLIKKLTMDFLCSPLPKDIPNGQANLTLLYQLCSTAKGRAILRTIFDKKPQLLRQLTAEKLCQEHPYDVNFPHKTFTSPFSVLCETQDGIALLNELFHAEHSILAQGFNSSQLRQKPLYAPAPLNTECIFKLCCYKEGCQFLLDLFTKKPALKTSLLTSFEQLQEQRIQHPDFGTSWLTEHATGQALCRILKSEEPILPSSSSSKPLVFSFADSKIKPLSLFNQLKQESAERAALKKASSVIIKKDTSKNHSLTQASILSTFKHQAKVAKDSNPPLQTDFIDPNTTSSLT